MRAENLLISLIGLFFCFLLICGGLVLFLNPYIPNLGAVLQHFVLHHWEGLSYVGLACFGMGLLILTVLYWLNQRRYLLLKMGEVSVSDHLIAHFVKEDLQAFFPNQPVYCDVIVKRKKKITIVANIPSIHDEKKEHTLQEIEKVLKATLNKQFQYDKKFIFNLSFSTL